MSAQVQMNQTLQKAVASKYEDGMHQAFQLWEEDKSWEAANMFERIAKAEQDEWLPWYYASQIYVLNSFEEQKEEKLTANLLKAQNFINEATSVSKDNAELLALQAQLYTVWIIFDGQKYGMLYSAKATDLYSRALALTPNNPRIILAKAEWDMGLASFFGKTVTSYCKDIQHAIDLFPNFKPEEAFYPTYGKERAIQVQKATCE